jgi:hypothetical protein
MRQSGQYMIGATAAVIFVGISYLMSLWRPGGVPVYGVIVFLGGIATLCYLIWRLATGRDGMIHRGPTARRLSRLNGGAVPRRGAEIAQSPRPLPIRARHGAPGTDGDPDKRLERELLVAVKKYGPGSDEVRAIATEIVRRPQPSPPPGRPRPSRRLPARPDTGRPDAGRPGLGDVAAAQAGQADRGQPHGDKQEP